MSQVETNHKLSGRSKKRRSKLRFEILNAFVDQQLINLSRSELAVWFLLFRDTKANGSAQASLADLARRGGMDRQTASRAVGELRRRGLLQVLKKGGLNRGPSTYRVLPFPMDACE